MGECSPGDCPTWLVIAAPGKLPAIALAALMRRFLSPSGIPSFSRSSSVSSGSTSRSIAFSMNAGSYFSSPRFRSQRPRSMGSALTHVLREWTVTNQRVTRELHRDHADLSLAQRNDTTDPQCPLWVSSRHVQCLSAIGHSPVPALGHSHSGLCVRLAP